MIASLALGISMGGYIGDVSLTLTLVCDIVACVFYVAAIITSSMIIRENRQRKSTEIAIQKRDFVLQMGVEYQVQQRGPLRPGAYKVLSTDENHPTFNLRLNNYVKACQHDTTIILAVGDTISARSGNVILR